MDKEISAQNRSARLDELIRSHFPPEGRTERIARAQAALNQDEPIRLTVEQWKWVAEDPDLEDKA